MIFISNLRHIVLAEKHRLYSNSYTGLDNLSNVLLFIHITICGTEKIPYTLTQSRNTEMNTVVLMNSMTSSQQKLNSHHDCFYFFNIAQH